VLLPEARAYIGKKCEIRWRDRDGNAQTTVAPVCDVTYVPLYGAFLITETDDIRLDRIQSLRALDAPEAVQSFNVCGVKKNPSR